MGMKRALRPRWVGAVGFVLLLGLLGSAGPTRGNADEVTPQNGNVIVIFRRGTDAGGRDQVLRQAGAVPRRHFKRVPAAAARIPHHAVRALLERHPEVVAVVPDRQVQAHAKPGGGSGQIVPEGVKRIGAAPGSLPWTGKGVGVAIVDTGLDLVHKDLKPLGASCFTAFTSCQDDNGHGTHVGGIVAARNNTVDVVGVAPNATLYAVKVLDGAGNGTDSTVIAGLDWVADNWDLVSPRIRVVNMSLGRPGSLGDNPALRQAVQDLYSRGITVVVSAGNDPALEVSQNVPATYPEVMAIASTTAVDGSNQCRSFKGKIARDTASWFTTDGEFDTSTGVGVTVSAPGEDKENILKNCFVSSVGILSTRRGGGTTRMSGTSMAAPHAAGVAALMWEKLGVVDPGEARSIIRSRADRIGSAPLNSATTSYTFDGEREGILWAPGALQ